MPNPDPAYVFLWEEGEPIGKRIARAARESVIAGPMGAYIRPAWYKSFLRIWGPSFDGADTLSLVHTSCAVAASTVLGWCGWELPKPWYADGSWGIMPYLKQSGKLSGAWMSPLNYDHPSWVWASSKYVPQEGDIFYRDYSRKSTANGHVGICDEGFDNLWITFEGGGSPDKKDLEGLNLTTAQIKATNGTLCRRSRDPKNIFLPDSLGRIPIGFWRAELLGLPMDLAKMPVG